MDNSLVYSPIMVNKITPSVQFKFVPCNQELTKVIKVLIQRMKKKIIKEL